LAVGRPAAVDARHDRVQDGVASDRVVTVSADGV
jgi:hypothetical protein